MKWLAVSVLGWVLVPLLALAQEKVELNTITGVKVNGNAVEITGTKKPNFTTFTMTDPPRLVIDISEAILKGVPEETRVNNGLITGLRSANYGSDTSAIARVLIGYDRDVETDIQVTGNTLVVKVLEGGGPLVAQAMPSPEQPDQPMQVATGPTATEAQAAAAQATTAAQQDQATQAKATADAAAAAKAERERQEKEKAEAAALAKKTEEDRRKQEEAARVEAAKKAEDERRAQELAAAEEKKRKAEEAESKRLAEAEEKKRKEAEARAEVEAKRQAELDEKKRKAEEAEARREAAAEEKKRKAEEAEAKRQAELEEKKHRAEEAESKRLAAAEEKKRKAEEAEAKREAEAEEKKRKDAEAHATRVASAEPVRHPEPESPPATSVSGRRGILEIVGFQQQAGGSRVYVRTNEPVSYKVSQGRNEIVLMLENTQIGKGNNTRALDTSFFDTAVARVDPTVGPDRSVRVSIKLKEQVPVQTRQEGNTISLEFARPNR